MTVVDNDRPMMLVATSCNMVLQMLEYKRNTHSCKIGVHSLLCVHAMLQR